MAADLARDRTRAGRLHGRSAGGAGAAEGSEAGELPFAGQKVVVVTQTGRSIGGPVEDHSPEWEAMTGGEVELQQFAFGELFEKMITSFSTGANDYDVLIFPADWAGDFMAPGYLEPIPQEILDGIEPDDIIPLYGERITAWGDTVYALPYDGDAHMLYYRKDLVNPESPYRRRLRGGVWLSAGRTADLVAVL